ncbi:MULTISPECIES: hypothetical protein [Williamsia]|uniref:mycothiol-dependent nitroreductase Rv2466c family protein n=1 Tax=Williamsia TaxID=85043 RepID=UPI00040A2CA9|nr:MULTISPECIES: hypothetical protein [Williamsia]
MSLAVLNEGADVPEHQQQHHIEVSRRLRRVFAAAHDKTGDSALGPIYTAPGQRVHHQSADVTTAMVADALSESGLDPQLADNLHDTYVSAVCVAHRESQDGLGGSGGSHRMSQLSRVRAYRPPSKLITSPGPLSGAHTSGRIAFYKPVRDSR